MRIGEAAPLERMCEMALELGRSHWFAACGTMLGAGERGELEQYLRGLGLPQFPIENVSGWDAASTTAQRADWSREWWDLDAAAAKDLKRQAIRRLGEVPVMEALSTLTEATAALYEPAAIAATNAGIEDQALIRVAAGAGAMAAHQMGLVLAAEASIDHPLACKYRLFSGGRWLLGVMGERCYLF